MLCFRCGSYNPDDATKCGICQQGFLEMTSKNPANNPRRSATTSMFSLLLTPGEVVQNRYQITEQIGQGVVGAVYRAHDREIGVDIALKAISPNLLQTEEEQKLFSKQMRQARKLQHPNIVRIYDEGHDGSRRFFTMKLLDGMSLRRIIRLRHEKGQSFTPAELVPIFHQLASALDYAHKTTWHGSLKPENILVLPDLLKITDFNLLKGVPLKPFLGIAKSRAKGFYYIAPELRVESTHVDGRADIYSLGVILAEMLLGIVYEGHYTRAFSAALEQLPVKIDGLIRRVLAEHPDGRFPTAGDFAKELESALTKVPVGTFPKPQPPAPATISIAAMPAVQIPMPAPATAKADANPARDAKNNPEPRPTPVFMPRTTPAPMPATASDKLEKAGHKAEKISAAPSLVDPREKKSPERSFDKSLDKAGEKTQQQSASPAGASVHPTTTPPPLPAVPVIERDEWSESSLTTSLAELEASFDEPLTPSMVSELSLLDSDALLSIDGEPISSPAVIVSVNSANSVNSVKTAKNPHAAPHAAPNTAKDTDKDNSALSGTSRAFAEDSAEQTQSGISENLQHIDSSIDGVEDVEEIRELGPSQILLIEPDDTNSGNTPMIASISTAAVVAALRNDRSELSDHSDTHDLKKKPRKDGKHERLGESSRIADTGEDDSESGAETTQKDVQQRRGSDSQIDVKSAQQHSQHSKTLRNLERGVGAGANAFGLENRAIDSDMPSDVDTISTKSSRDQPPLLPLHGDEKQDSGPTTPTLDMRDMRDVRERAGMSSFVADEDPSSSSFESDEIFDEMTAQNDANALKNDVHSMSTANLSSRVSTNSMATSPLAQAPSALKSSQLGSLESLRDAPRLAAIESAEALFDSGIHSYDTAKKQYDDEEDSLERDLRVLRGFAEQHQVSKLDAINDMDDDRLPTESVVPPSLQQKAGAISLEKQGNPKTGPIKPPDLPTRTMMQPLPDDDDIQEIRDVLDDSIPRDLSYPDGDILESDDIDALETQSINPYDDDDGNGDGAAAGSSGHAGKGAGKGLGSRLADDEDADELPPQSTPHAASSANKAAGARKSIAEDFDEADSQAPTAFPKSLLDDAAAAKAQAQLEKDKASKAAKNDDNGRDNGRDKKTPPALAPISPNTEESKLSGPVSIGHLPSAFASRTPQGVQAAGQPSLVQRLAATPMLWIGLGVAVLVFGIYSIANNDKDKINKINANNQNNPNVAVNQNGNNGNGNGMGNNNGGNNGGDNSNGSGGNTGNGGVDGMMGDAGAFANDNNNGVNNPENPRIATNPPNPNGDVNTNGNSNGNGNNNGNTGNNPTLAVVPTPAPNANTNNGGNNGTGNLSSGAGSIWNGEDAGSQVASIRVDAGAPVPTPVPAPTSSPTATPAATAGKHLECPTKGMKLVDAGSFQFGSVSSDPMRNFGERSMSSTDTAAYCIDYYEYPNSPSAVPSVGVSWNAAKSTCESKGLRLCTEAEWERACKGPSNLRFPYGNQWDVTACNTQDEEGNARELSTAKQFKKCRSGYGVYSMAGNAEEWTADSFSPGSANKTVKGGSSGKADWASRCAARRGLAPRTSESLLGFRCCGDPKEVADTP